MTDNLPPIRFLDEAARALDFCSWADVPSLGWTKDDPLWDSIIAHARTLEQLAKHDPSIKPVGEDLLIAREICARVAEEMAEYGMAEDYRNGDFDCDSELQFALSMLKRDPEALAAFRKEKGL